MAVAIVGISLQPHALEALDYLAGQLGLNRSATVAKLVMQRLGSDKPLEVLVDGVPYLRPEKATPVEKPAERKNPWAG